MFAFLKSEKNICIIFCTHIDLNHCYLVQDFKVAPVPLQFLRNLKKIQKFYHFGLFILLLKLCMPIIVIYIVFIPHLIDLSYNHRCPVLYPPPPPTTSPVIRSASLGFRIKISKEK
jgi:hypothetical protein